ncbi:hypothetical protein [Halalkalibacter alkalisediminis]|uniref:Uncharacterized protein n=1 Tax=Halalkalibacter alkalisediminis TaxID=935616 RepID=A0ABV6NDG1_9BACI
MRGSHHHHVQLFLEQFVVVSDQESHLTAPSGEQQLPLAIRALDRQMDALPHESADKY